MTIDTLARRLGLAFLALLVAGCTSGESAVSPDETPLLGLTPSEDGVRFEVEATLDRARLSGADDEQILLLEDGLLTFAEYESALLRTIECSTEEGVEVVNLGVEVDSDGTPKVNYAVPVSVEGMTNQQVEEKFAHCYETTAGTADGLWQLGNSPRTQPGVLEAQIEGLVACLNENGLAVAEGSIAQENLIEGLMAADEVLANGGPDCVAESGLSG